jgi:hypothetical protein
LAELRSPLEKSYRNTIYCASTLRQQGGKLQGKYCGNRWCLVCNRVRTARAINRYKPVLDSWTDPQFVTLTIRNVPGEDLGAALGEMLAQFAAVRRGITRTDKLVVKAIRKLECTHNQHRGDYHPHFHAIVEGRAVADALRKRWVKAWGDRAEFVAQDVRAATPGSAHELFKYFTKLATKAGGGKTEYIPAAALDVIFQAMRGRRVWQPVGFTAPATVDEEDEIGTDGDTDAPSEAGEGAEWEWEQAQHDWVDYRTGELLTGFEPNRAARKFAEHFTDNQEGEHGQNKQVEAGAAGAAGAAGGEAMPCPAPVVRGAERDAGRHYGRVDAGRNRGAAPARGHPAPASSGHGPARHAVESGAGQLRQSLGVGGAIEHTQNRSINA